MHNPLGLSVELGRDLGVWGRRVEGREREGSEGRVYGSRCAAGSRSVGRSVYCHLHREAKTLRTINRGRKSVYQDPARREISTALFPRFPHGTLILRMQTFYFWLDL